MCHLCRAVVATSSLLGGHGKAQSFAIATEVGVEVGSRAGPFALALEAIKIKLSLEGFVLCLQFFIKVNGKPNRQCLIGEQ